MQIRVQLQQTRVSTTILIIQYIVAVVVLVQLLFLDEKCSRWPHYGKCDVRIWMMDNATFVRFKWRALHIVFVYCSVQFEILSTQKMGCDILMESILKGIVVSHQESGVRFHQINGRNN